ncbi:hypothetical protein BDM02DRAFT_1974976 [Thelephora ganbajun]|uniref:Uncharacterized protein n=1 Tax=Thelephora ganbajun TaxID=370292 RepID=A0ACB6YZE2_THEGA|nr:hypothetical protein BDM02DRAFT_1974976 [Thelephora ganbajun]
MVWCTCPVRCKGGREVAERTRSKHQNELQAKEDRRLIEQHFPERLDLLPDTSGRKRRANDDGTQGTRRKGARGDNRQQGEAEIQLVRVFTNLSSLRLMLRQGGRSR